MATPAPPPRCRTYRHSPDRPLPYTGDLREDLTRWAQEIVVVRNPASLALLRGGSGGRQRNH